jgi:hypothetical protein
MQPGPSRPLSTQPSVRRAVGRTGALPALRERGPVWGRVSCRQDFLAAKSQIFDDVSVAFDFGRFEIVQQAAALTDHAQQAAT